MGQEACHPRDMFFRYDEKTDTLLDKIISFINGVLMSTDCAVKDLELRQIWFGMNFRDEIEDLPLDRRGEFFAALAAEYRPYWRNVEVNMQAYGSIKNGVVVARIDLRP